MKISTKGRYALKVMIDLASHPGGEYISLKDIAVRLNVTVKYLEQIVSGLSKAGYLESMRGTTGGHRLAKSPSEYNVGDILRSVEGNLTPIECAAGETGQGCPLSSSCNTMNFWMGLDKVVNDYINSYTLADLIDTN